MLTRRWSSHLAIPIVSYERCPLQSMGRLISNRATEGGCGALRGGCARDPGSRPQCPQRLVFELPHSHHPPSMTVTNLFSPALNFLVLSGVVSSCQGVSLTDASPQQATVSLWFSTRVAVIPWCLVQGPSGDLAVSKVPVWQQVAKSCPFLLVTGTSPPADTCGHALKTR